MPDVVIPPTAQAGQILTSVGNGNQVQWKAPRSNTSGATTSTLPAGLIMDYAGSSTPAGWLLCDGSAYDTTTYASLFAAIGYTWGSSGSNFKVPDLRGVMTLGAGYNADATVTYSLATTGGAVKTTLITANLPAHTHVVNDSGHNHGVTDGGHTHGGPSGNNYMTRNTAGAFFTGTTTANMSQAATTASATTGISVNSGTTGITLQNTGSGTAATTISPYAVTNKIIKT